MAELKIWMVNLIVFHPPGISDDFSDPQLPGMEFLVSETIFLTVWRNSNFQSTPNRLNIIIIEVSMFQPLLSNIATACRKKHVDPPKGPGWLCYQVGIHSGRCGSEGFRSIFWTRTPFDPENQSNHLFFWVSWWDRHIHKIYWKFCNSWYGKTIHLGVNIEISTENHSKFPYMCTVSSSQYEQSNDVLKVPFNKRRHEFFGLKSKDKPMNICCGNASWFPKKTLKMPKMAGKNTYISSDVDVVPKKTTSKKRWVRVQSSEMKWTPTPKDRNLATGEMGPRVSRLLQSW